MLRDPKLRLALILRDEIADGLNVRKGAALDPLVIFERANNLADRIMARFHVSMRLDLCAVCVDGLPPNDALPYGPGRAHAACVMTKQQEERT